MLCVSFLRPFSPMQGQRTKVTRKKLNKHFFKVFDDTTIKSLNIFTLFKTVAQPDRFQQMPPKIQLQLQLKLISNEMVLAVSIANQIVVFTSQILRDMAITLTPNSHTHPKPKNFLLRFKQTTDFTTRLFPFDKPVEWSIFEI